MEIPEKRSLLKRTAVHICAITNSPLPTEESFLPCGCSVVWGVQIRGCGQCILLTSNPDEMLTPFFSPLGVGAKLPVWDFPLSFVHVTERLLLNDKTLGFLASGGDEFKPGPETRLDRSELLCNKVLLKYKRDREHFWHRHQKGAERVPPASLQLDVR